MLLAVKTLKVIGVLPNMSKSPYYANNPLPSLKPTILLSYLNGTKFLIPDPEGIRQHVRDCWQLLCVEASDLQCQSTLFGK